jgi:hypothetical protein
VEGGQLMKSLTTIAAALPLLIALALVSPSAAAPPATPSFHDSVAGSGSSTTATAFAVNITSGPSGESPTGRATLDTFGVHFVASSITCLAVTGNTATYAGALEPNLFGLAYFKVTDVDNGPAGSNLDTGAAEGSNTPEDCTTPTFGSLGHLTSGDLVVTDAPPPPSSTRQCLSGGYRAYGFATTGLCVAYVNAGRLAAGDSRG